MKNFFRFTILAVAALMAQLAYGAPTATPIVTGTPTVYASGSNVVVKFRTDGAAYARIYYTNPNATPYANSQTNGTYTNGVRTFAFSGTTGGYLVKVQAYNKSSGVTYNEVGPIAVMMGTATPSHTRTPTPTPINTPTRTPTPPNPTPTTPPAATATPTPCCNASWIDFQANTTTGYYDARFYDACRGCTVIGGTPMGLPE